MRNKVHFIDFSGVQQKYQEVRHDAENFQSFNYGFEKAFPKANAITFMTLHNFHK